MKVVLYVMDVFLCYIRTRTRMCDLTGEIAIAMIQFVHYPIGGHIVHANIAQNLTTLRWEVMRQTIQVFVLTYCTHDQYTLTHLV